MRGVVRTWAIRTGGCTAVTISDRAAPHAQWMSCSSTGCPTFVRMKQGAAICPALIVTTTHCTTALKRSLILLTLDQPSAAGDKATEPIPTQRSLVFCNQIITKSSVCSWSRKNQSGRVATAEYLIIVGNLPHFWILSSHCDFATSLSLQCFLFLSHSFCPPCIIFSVVERA